MMWQELNAERAGETHARGAADRRLHTGTFIDIQDTTVAETWQLRSTPEGGEIQPYGYRMRGVIPNSVMEELHVVTATRCRDLGQWHVCPKEIPPCFSCSHSAPGPPSFDRSWHFPS